MKHKLPQLPYAYDALEPFIDEQTMEIHHGKHHATYVAKLNETLEKHPILFKKTLDNLLENLDDIPKDIRTAVINFGGGVWNHSFFWKSMISPKAGGGGQPNGDLADMINKHFGSFPTFKEQFIKAAVGFFGGGWVWLTLESWSGKFLITTTQNQDTPITLGLTPLLCLDVWEHAYYLKYQNRRSEYIENWWNVVNWEEVNRLFQYGK